MDQFELYFQRADLDRDGRISGAEAVGFFQGSNLPKPVLAQVLSLSLSLSLSLYHSIGRSDDNFVVLLVRWVYVIMLKN